MKTRLASAGVLTLGLVLGSAQLAQADGAYGWSFDGPSGSAVDPGAAFGSPALYASSDTRLTYADPSVGGGLDVASWRALSPGATIPLTAMILSTDPDLGRGVKAGSDGASNAYDVGLGDFSFGAWVKPTAATAYPLGSRSISSVSPNIMQKGLSSSNGGFWKLSLQLVSTPSGLRWAPACFLKAGGKAARANTGKGAMTLDPAVGYTLTCSRDDGRLTLTAVRDDGQTFSSTTRQIANFAVNNSFAVAVAKKPGSSDPGDAYDGQINDVVLSTS